MNQHPFYWSSSTGIAPIDFITIIPSSYVFSYESGQSYMFQISGTTGYTITTGVSWLSIDSTGGTSGITYVTVETLLNNSGVTDWGPLYGVIITSLDSSIVTRITITQTFEPQPLLFVMTEGGSFVGELI